VQQEIESRLVAANSEAKRLQGQEEELSSKLKRREDRLAMVEQEAELLRANEASGKKAAEELSEARSKLAQMEPIVKDLTVMNARREEVERELETAKQKLSSCEKEAAELKAECGEKAAALAAAEARCLELEAAREQLVLRNKENAEVR
jgi:chromosome segregation ATPase